ncbi:hypothetical protein CAC42_2337 [Sphaceloma murrayae]|uniref:Uncharacterized protein n=1 Tax=Sphaceloma murrayae TaxID=2082308 RepID=A0A2K1QIY2_9PEZI|nr:hypothetical protein CAC42_2337 [Sphaceloma murrayae]
MHTHLLLALASLVSLAHATCSSFTLTNTTRRVPGPNVTISDGVYCPGPRNCSINTSNPPSGQQGITPNYGGIASDRATLNLTLPFNETIHILSQMSNATGIPFYTIMQLNITTKLGTTLRPGQAGWTIFEVQHTCVTGMLEGCGAQDPPNGTIVTGCTPSAPPQANCAFSPGFHCMDGTITWRYSSAEEANGTHCRSCMFNMTADQTRLVTNTSGLDENGQPSSGTMVGPASSWVSVAMLSLAVLVFV